MSRPTEFDALYELIGDLPKRIAQAIADIQARNAEAGRVYDSLVSRVAQLERELAMYDLKDD